MAMRRPEFLGEVFLDLGRYPEVLKDPARDNEAFVALAKDPEAGCEAAVGQYFKECFDLQRFTDVSISVRPVLLLLKFRTNF